MIIKKKAYKYRVTSIAALLPSFSVIFSVFSTFVSAELFREIAQKNFLSATCQPIRNFVTDFAQFLGSII